MDQIKYTINGINYILVEDVVYNGNKEKYKRKLKHFSAIEQSVKELKLSIWHLNYVIIKILVPEDKIMEWQNWQN